MLTRHVPGRPVPFGDPDERDRGSVPAAWTNLLVDVHRSMDDDPTGTYVLEFTAKVDRDAGTVTYGCDISQVPSRPSGETAIP